VQPAGPKKARTEPEGKKKMGQRKKGVHELQTAGESFKGHRTVVGWGKRITPARRTVKKNLSQPKEGGGVQVRGEQHRPFFHNPGSRNKCGRKDTTITKNTKKEERLKH